MSERAVRDPGPVVRVAVVAAVLVPVFGALIWAGLSLTGTRSEPSVPPPAKVVKRGEPLSVRLAPTLANPARVDEALADPAIFSESGELRETDKVAIERSAAASLEMSRLDDAIRPLKQLVRLEPENARRWAAPGEAIDRAGDRDLAIDVYRQSIALDPHDPTANYRLGVALLSDNAQLDAALACLNTANAAEVDETKRKRIKLHIRTAESLIRSRGTP